MVHAQAFDLVEGQQNPREEELVFLLQRKSESIDNGAKNFQQLGNSVETFSLVRELEKHVVDRASNEGSKV
jgi:hypothetical protein